MRKFLLPLTLLLILFAALVSYLDSFPPLVWDEGWTATVARNWVERGFYGMYLSGEPAPAGQSAAFPSVLSIAAAFQWFGIGFWQGRFVSVLYMMGAFAALYALGRRLYDARAAALSILALVPFASMVHLHALYIGRNILAEPPMLFFLLMGFLFLLSALEAKVRLKAVLAVLCAAIMWSLALDSKAQPLPFWTVALVSGLGYCAYQRRWREAGLVGAVFASSLVFMEVWVAGLELLLSGQSIRGTATPGLLNLTALVPVPAVRINAFLTFLLTGLLLLFGLILATQKWLRGRESKDRPVHLTLLVLLTFVWSWVLWYLLLSIGWERYLFPASFVGSIFVGLLFDQLILPFLVRDDVPHVRRSYARLALVGTVTLVSILYLVLTLWQLPPQIRLSNFARATTAWMNANLPPTALVETYEMEILFGLEARAHYPPDTLNVEMNRKREIDPTLVLSYDPRAVNPDYLVVGYVARRFHIYDEMLREGKFVPLIDLGSYTIYRNTMQLHAAGGGSANP